MQIALLTDVKGSSAVIVLGTPRRSQQGIDGYVQALGSEMQNIGAGVVQSVENAVEYHSNTPIGEQLTDAFSPASIEGTLSIAGTVAVGGAATNIGKTATNITKIVANGEANIGKNIITVTEKGVALPKRAKIPSEFVQNPYRSSSYGVFENGKFMERLRIDQATPSGFKGPNQSHFHLNNGSHIFNQAKWPWWH
jgi:hypothetical protein